MDLKVPAVDGSQWTAAERQREEKSLCGNDLQTLLDFCGSPQNDAVERVMGIEPTLAAWEAAVLPLNYTREGAKSMPRTAPTQRAPGSGAREQRFGRRHGRPPAGGRSRPRGGGAR